MKEIGTRASRITLLTAVFAAVIMFGSPVLQLGNNNVDLNAVDNASAGGPGDRTLRVGWTAFQDMMKTLNPFLPTWGAEYDVIWWCMSTLMTYDEDQNIVGDLATNWTITDGGLTWTIKLSHFATFYDRLNPTAYHPVTSSDVKFSFWLSQNQTGNHLQSYFPIIPGTGERVISGIDTPDPYTVVFHLRAQYAPFSTAFVNIPILPEYIWSTRAWNWANFDFKKAPNVPPIVGSGPFYYVLNGLPTAGTVDLRRSPTWFQNEERGYDIHVDRLLIISQTEATNYAEYMAGNLDVITNPTVEQWLTGGIPGNRWTSSQGYVWEFNMNQMTDANRAALGGGFTRGSNNQLLLDSTVKTALRMSVDKQFIAHDVFKDTARPADSLAPQTHPYYYNYGSNPVLDTQVISVNPQAAWDMLYASGWQYRLDGVLITSGMPEYRNYYPLSKKVGGSVSDTLQFRFITPNTDSNYDPSCIDIRDKARLAGIDLMYNGPSTAAFMDNSWAIADYDTWLWNWWMTPVYDISTEIMIYFTTESIPIGWSDVFYSNATYDEIYYQSMSAMNPVDRKLITDELQRIGYEDSGCWPTVWIDFLYAAQSVAPDYWTNWGDWGQHFTLTADAWYYWLFMKIEPDETVDNGAPDISGVSARYTGLTTSPVEFTGASVLDDTPWYDLEYRWNFGDGYNTTWRNPIGIGNFTANHTYAKDGYYDVYFMVREKNTTDKFGNWAKSMAVVSDLSNYAPTDPVFTWSPNDPDFPDSGTIVHFYGNATDTKWPTDVLSYTWNFGDGTTGAGQNVTHQFKKGAGYYDVYMYVDDGHLGTGTRPVPEDNLVRVDANHVPTCVAKDEPAVQKATSWKFTATVSDVDTRDRLRLTWDWGDGNPVTVMNIAGPVTSPTQFNAYHTYKFSGDFTLTVYSDDKTGLSGHNYSDPALVHVARIGNHVPVITDFHASNELPTNEEVVTFYGTAVDDDSDLCVLNFTFGDGEWQVVSQTTANTTVTATHVYPVAGLYLAYLDVTDTQNAAPTEGPIIMDVSQAKFTLNLVSGWNFVSVPRVGWGYMASTLGLLDGDIVAGWEPNEGYNQNYVVGFPLGDFAINGSTGYWIYAGVAEALDLYGAVPTSLQIRTIDVPSGGGWAIVGFNSLNTTRHASDIPAMYSAGVDQVASYDPVTGDYISYVVGFPLNDFALVPGQAYWCYFFADGLLSYAP